MKTLITINYETMDVHVEGTITPATASILRKLAEEFDSPEIRTKMELSSTGGFEIKHDEDKDVLI